jgi:DNA polymerase-3 subunit gamma/tau
MSYLVLARKWRPQSFEDLIGQEPIVRILKNSITQGKIAHAYVFSGPRGVGKTSTARILAKGLNCAEGPTPEPCGKCDVCTSISDGSSIDVSEIDGASNNSVDDIRDLRDRVKYAPSGGKYKIYIIDEAHMLSTSAFNALLKTLEEPPPHVVFVLATTEPRKIPLTVMSRCQHLPFRRISLREIKKRLSDVSSAENIEISDQALSLVARASDGSIRDSLTILDQLVSFSSNIEASDVNGLLDTADFSALGETADAILQSNREQILRIVGELVDRGTDLRAYTKDLIKFFRDILVVKVMPDSEQMADLSDEELVMLRSLADKTSDEYLVLLLSEMIKAESDVKASFSPRVALEMSLIKLSFLGIFRNVKDAISTLASSGQTEIPEKKMNAPNDPELATPSTNKQISSKKYTGKSLLEAIIERVEDPKVSSYLANASAEINNNTLILIFNGAEADICAKPFKDKPELIENIASDILGLPIRLEIKIIEPESPKKKTDLKKMVMSEPVIKEALDLFEGRVVDIKKIS